MATLWKINDGASRSLMIDFYENLWKKKLPKLEALRQAQLTMMRDGIKRAAWFSKTSSSPTRTSICRHTIGPLLC